MFIRNKKNKRIISYLLLAVFSLQVVYVLLKNSDHHHHDHTLHTLEEELNPCHRTIFHNDLDHGCDHKNHFGEKQDDCAFCKYYNVNYFELKIDFLDINFNFEINRLDYINFSYNRPQLITQTRGPPFYMI